MKKTKRKLKILIIVAIILLISLSSILIIAKKIDTKKRIELKKIDTTFEEQEAKLEIKVNNLYELVKLSTREIEINEYTEGIQSLINGKFQETYNETKNLNNTQLQEQFNKNKEKIFQQYGIEDIDTYKKLIEKIEIYEDDINVLDVSIEKDSCHVENENIISKLKIKYDNNKEIELTLRFANSKYAIYPYLRIL